MGKLKQISYTLSSNIVATIISVLVTFIVPKILGITDYGLFQLYLFYFGYIGFFHFGWADGFFLRYGGKYYEELNQNLLKTELIAFSIFQCLVSTVIYSISFMNVKVTEKRFIFICIGIVMVFYNIRLFYQYLLQATERIKEYAITVIIEKIVYFIVIALLIILGIKNFRYYVVANIIGVIISLLYAVICCKNVLYAKLCAISDLVKEINENLKVGSKLLLANIASLLIIGIVRQAIELKWDVEQFGKLSLSISISNMLVMLINSIAVVLFPMLKRMEVNKIKPLYSKLDNCISSLLYLIMAFYYPVRVIISAWIPQYAESLLYLAILFPMCIYECEVSLLTTTYLKVLRKENIIMYINITTVILSVFLTGISVFLLENITLSIFSLLFLSSFRCIVSQIMLGKNLSISIKEQIINENLMVLLFIVSNYFIKGVCGMIIYVVAVCSFFILNKKNIIDSFKF